jgi:hypothetical protein
MWAPEQHGALAERHLRLQRRDQPRPDEGQQAGSDGTYAHD